MEKILVVENNKVFLRLFRNYLEGKGYEVVTAEDGLEALEVLEYFRPRIIFVDLVMPRINGEKLCRILRGMPALAQVALVVVSAIAAEGEVDCAVFGADACIAKGAFKVMQAHIDTVLAHVATGQLAELRGKVFGVEGITQRQITRELIAVGRHFEVTLDHMTDGFIELTREGAILSVNRAASVMFGLAEEQLLASSFPRLFPEANRRRIMAVVQQLKGEPVEIGEEDPFLVQSRFLLLKFVPVAEQGRQSIIVLVHDITRNKQAELELRLHRDSLEALVAERTAALQEKNAELEDALAKVKTLSGLLPICASCKKIRDDNGYWNQIETYLRRHSDAEFSHSICPDCARKLYPKIFGSDAPPEC